MRVIKPKIIGTLKVQRMLAGNYAVINGIKNAPNKLIIPCDSYEHGLQIIKRLKNCQVECFIRSVGFNQICNFKNSAHVKKDRFKDAKLTQIK